MITKQFKLAGTYLERPHLERSLALLCFRAGTFKVNSDDIYVSEGGAL